MALSSYVRSVLRNVTKAAWNASPCSLLYCNRAILGLMTFFLIWRCIAKILEFGGDFRPELDPLLIKFVSTYQTIDDHAADRVIGICIAAFR